MPSRAGDVIKAVLEMSIVDFARAAPLIAKGTITRGGWTVCVETNDPLDMTTETREQLSALVACAEANGYQIGQTFKQVRVRRKVAQAAQKFVRRMCEPIGLLAWMSAHIRATMTQIRRDLNISLYSTPVDVPSGLSAWLPSNSVFSTP